MKAKIFAKIFRKDRIEWCILADILNGFVPFPWNPCIFRSRRRGGRRARRKTRHHFRLVSSLVSDHRRQSCDRKTTTSSVQGKLWIVENDSHGNAETLLTTYRYRFYGFEIWKTISNSDLEEKRRGIRDDFRWEVNWG